MRENKNPFIFFILFKVAHSKDEIILIKDCLITLVSVGLASRNIEVPNDMHEKSITDILNNHFNVGTEKAHDISSYNMMRTMEHSPLKKIKKQSKLKKVNKLINKNEIKNEDAYSKYDGETFASNCCLVHDVMKYAIKPKDDHIMWSRAGFKLLEHRKLKCTTSAHANIKED